MSTTCGRPTPGRHKHFLDHQLGEFGSLILKGGYYEVRAHNRTPDDYTANTRHRWSWGTLPRTMNHAIRHVVPNTWTLVVHGPRRETWGFYTAEGWVEWHDYDGAGQTDIGKVD